MSIAENLKLQNFLQIMKALACICETWFTNDKGKFSHTNKGRGFELYHNYRPKRGGEVAIIFKNDLLITKGEASCSKYKSFGYVYVTCKTGVGTILVLNIYRNQEVPSTIFKEELVVPMDKVAAKRYSLLVVGDFNVWIEVEQNQDTKGLLEIMHWFGLAQHVSERTHKFVHTLEHIYFNEFESTKNDKVLDDTYGLSTYHYPIVVNTPQPQWKTTYSKSTYRNIRPGKKN